MQLVAGLAVFGNQPVCMWLLTHLMLLDCRHEPYNLKVDVYSFAMIIFQLFETTVPFHGHDPVDAARQAAMLGARPSFPPRKTVSPMMQVSWHEPPDNPCVGHEWLSHAPLVPWPHPPDERTPHVMLEVHVNITVACCMLWVWLK